MGFSGTLVREEDGANIEKINSAHKDANQDLDKNNSWFRNIMEEDETNIKENTGFDVKPKGYENNWR